MVEKITSSVTNTATIAERKHHYAMAAVVMPVGGGQVVTTRYDCAGLAII
jgi:hypothetical protein